MPMNGMGRAAALASATPPPTAATPPPPTEEAGEEYGITPDELTELNQNKTVTCGDGVTVFVKDPEGTETASEPPMPFESEG